jgi:hypothetical protein
MPQKKWILGKFKMMRYRLYSETAKRYQALLTFENTTVQDDSEAYVNWRLKGGKMK